MLSYLSFRSLYFLKRGKISHGGRNFLGRVCVQGRGFLKKKSTFIKVDFFRRLSSSCILFKFIYDVNRTGRLGLFYYANGLVSSILLAENLRLGERVNSGNSFCDNKIRKGDAVTIRFMPLFSLLNSIELRKGKGGQIARAGGASSVLVGKTDTHGILKLKSGWQVTVALDCISTMGAVYSKFKKNFNVYKAGKMRNMGFRPKVRGVAKNPCDHAHGGGNGKRSKPKVPVNAHVTCYKWRPTKNTQKERLHRRKFKKLDI